MCVTVFLCQLRHSTINFLPKSKMFDSISIQICFFVLNHSINQLHLIFIQMKHVDTVVYRNLLNSIDNEKISEIRKNRENQEAFS